ncbi:hypothetical protein ACMZOO_17800 (plasmid) [Catenovulum sp. SX2]
MKGVKIKLFKFTLLFQSKLVLLAVVVMMLAAAVWGYNHGYQLGVDIFNK